MDTRSSTSTPVTQKKDIKKQQGRLEALKREAEEEKERARVAARERVLLEFEKSQLILASSSVIGAKSTTPSNNGSSERESRARTLQSIHGLYCQNSQGDEAKV
jgi:hypothetical protein